MNLAHPRCIEECSARRFASRRSTVVSLKTQRPEHAGFAIGARAGILKLLMGQFLTNKLVSRFSDDARMARLARELSSDGRSVPPHSRRRGRFGDSRTAGGGAGDQRL